MQEISELINVLGKNPNHHSSELLDQLSHAPKMLALYNLASRFPDLSEIDALKAIYPDTQNQRNFRTLKDRLKSTLIKHLLFLDIKDVGYNSTQHYYLVASRGYLAVRRLMFDSATTAAVSIAIRSYKLARRLEFTGIAVLICRLLQFHYGVVDSNQVRFGRYSAELRKLRRIQEAEIEAEIAYANALMKHGTSQRTLSKSEIAQISSAANLIRNTYSEINSRRFVRISYLLQIAAADFANDNALILKYSKEAIDILDAKPYDTANLVFSFKLKLLVYYIKQEEFKPGRKIANHYIRRLIAGSYNWHVTTYYYFILSARAADYIKCYGLVKSALKPANFYKLNPRLKELWRINEAYASLLQARGLVDPPEEELIKPFRIYRFLNQVPIFSQDKRGVNIAVLIIHVLFLLHQNKRGKIIDRVDALNRYCHRHLRRDETFRSNCFIQMLLQMPRADFNRMRTERYAEKYRKKLATMPLKTARQSIEVEVFPYEHLWQIVLEMLD